MIFLSFVFIFGCLLAITDGLDIVSVIVSGEVGTSSSTTWHLVSPDIWEVEVEANGRETGQRLIRRFTDKLEENDDFLNAGCSSTVEHTNEWFIDCPAAVTVRGEIEIGCCGELRILQAGLSIKGIHFDSADSPSSTQSPSPAQPSSSLEEDSRRRSEPSSTQSREATEIVPPPPPPPTPEPVFPSPTLEPVFPSPTLEPVFPSPSPLSDVIPPPLAPVIESPPPIPPPPPPPTPEPVFPSPTPEPVFPSPSPLSDVIPPPLAPVIEPPPPIPPPPPPPVSPTPRERSFVRSVTVRERNSLLISLNLHLDYVTSIYVEYFPSSPLDHPNIPHLRTIDFHNQDRYETVDLFRLYEKTEYQYDVYEIGVDEPKYTDFFRTQSVDADIRRKDPELIYGEPTFELVYSARDGPAFHFIHDSRGELVWYLEQRGLPGDNIQRKTNNNTVIITKTGGLTELSPHGDIVTNVEPYCFKCHHSLSIQPKEENIIWTAARERVDKDSPEMEEYRFRHDQADDTILRVDLETGDFDVAIRMRDYFDFEEDRTSFSDAVSDASGLFPCSNGTANDWIRLNSVFSVNESYLIVGSHHFEEAFGFYEDTFGDWELHWRLSADEERSDFRWIDENDKFYGEHEITMLPNENLLIFDNGIGRPHREGGWYSRGLELELDFEERTVRSVWQFALNVSEFVTEMDYLNSDLYGEEEEEEEDCSEVILGLCISNHRGSLQRFENGNTAIVFLSCDCDPTKRGYLAEVDRYGNLVSLISQERAGSQTQDSGIIQSVATEIVVVTYEIK